MSIATLNEMSQDTLVRELGRFASGEVTYVRRQHHNATYGLREIEAYVSPVTIEDRYFIYAIIHNITDRVRAQWALQESERWFRAIFDTARVSIGLLALDGTVLAGNRTALDFIGRPKTDVVGRLFWDTPWWEGRPALQATLRSAIVQAAAGKPARFEVTPNPSADGRTITVEFLLTPVFDETGKVVLLVPDRKHNYRLCNLH